MGYAGNMSAYTGIRREFVGSGIIRTNLQALFIRL